MKKDPMILDGEQQIPRTIAGYLDLFTSVGVPSNVDPRTFLFNVSKFNQQLPRNVINREDFFPIVFHIFCLALSLKIYLLCGDRSLELLGKVLEFKRTSTNITPFVNSWRTITQSLRSFVHKIGERRGIRLMTFIDTSSSFNIATEIALAASERIILPVTEDHLHRHGVDYLFR